MQRFRFLHISLLPRSDYRLLGQCHEKSCDIIIVRNIPGDVTVINDFVYFEVVRITLVSDDPISGGSGASVTFSVSTDSDVLTIPVDGSVCVTTMVMRKKFLLGSSIRRIVHVNISSQHINKKILTTWVAFVLAFCGGYKLEIELPSLKPNVILGKIRRVRIYPSSGS